MAVIHDTAELRLVVFRIEPGQQVAPHTSTSSVTLEVLEGIGVVSGPDGELEVAGGDLVCFAPGELHGMRAAGGRFCLLAMIAPRPGGR
jgi:quercetin dioxygenase-like cupin family protein